MHSQPSGGTVPLSPPRPAPSRVTGPVLALVLGCAYFSAAESSFVLVAKPEQIPAFWPASGLSAGILVAIGARAYLPVAVAVAAATLPPI